MNILFFVFGDNLASHLQAHLCIRTVLKQHRKQDSVYVYTDKPKFYKHFNQIHTVGISSEQLKTWIGPSGYIFRAKIKAIEALSELCPDEHLLFLDCDTFIYGNLRELENKLSQGRGLMHTKEGHPSRMKGASLQMWKALSKENIEGIELSEKHCVWNSGVIGIPANKLNIVIPKALRICDYMLGKKINCFTVEQYAFAIAMIENTQLTECLQWVGHYWGNKQEWTELATNFFLTSYMEGTSLEDELELLSVQLLKKIPIFIKKSNTRKRLEKKLSKWFPDKNFRLV